MAFSASVGSLRDQQSTGFVAVPLLVTEGVGAISGVIPTELAGFDIPRRLSAGWLKTNGLSEKPGSSTVLRSTTGVSVILVSVGKNFNEAESWRLVGGAVIQIAGTEMVNFLLPLDLISDASGCAQALTEGAALSAYDYKVSDKETTLTVVPLGSPVPSPDSVSQIELAIADALTTTELVNWAKRLIDTPPRDASPRKLAKAFTKRLEQEDNVKVEVWDEDRVKDEGMGGLIGVGRGSNEPVRLVYATYRPKAGDSIPHVVLVGKGITFDSGGLSIKPADSMMTMKSDMSGSAIVMATLAACAELGLNLRVTAIAPMSENMTGGSATRPGDVLTIRNGTTVEVLNTDAEGRLVLADGLTLATEIDPSLIIDIATLTGAQRVALGDEIGAYYSTSEGVAESLEASSKATGELLWRMPLHEGYNATLDSDVADLKNIGSGGGGSITAALFLQRFVANNPWVHMDIASTARTETGRGYLTRGATAFGVRTLVHLLSEVASQGKVPSV
jgi:leucyl aminopeptidase